MPRRCLAFLSWVWLFWFLRAGVTLFVVWFVILPGAIRAVDESEIRAAVLQSLPTPPTSGAIHATFTLSRRLPGDILRAYNGDSADGDKQASDYRTDYECWIDGQHYWYSMEVPFFDLGKDLRLVRHFYWGTVKKAFSFSPPPKEARPAQSTIHCQFAAIFVNMALPPAYFELLGLSGLVRKGTPLQPKRDLVNQGTIEVGANGERLTFQNIVEENGWEKTIRAAFRKQNDVYLCELFENSVSRTTPAPETHITRETFTYDSILSNQTCGTIPVSCMSEGLNEEGRQLSVNSFNRFQLVSYSIESVIPTKLLNPSLGRNVEIVDTCNPPKPPSASSWGFYWWVILIVSILLVAAGVWRMERRLGS